MRALAATLVAAMVSCGGRTGAGDVASTGAPAATRRISVQVTGEGEVRSDPAGIDCGPTCAASFVAQVNVRLLPTAHPGWRFDGWGGACSGPGECRLPAATDPAAVFATFVLAAPVGKHTLTVSVTGAGAVRSQNPAFECRQAVCKIDLGKGDHLQLTAAPDAGARFDGWSGACSGQAACEVAGDGDSQIEASFSTGAPASTRPVSVQVNGQGDVRSDPAGIDCGSTCAASFPAQVTVSLVASARPGWRFDGWGGACSGPGECRLPSATDPAAVFATFVLPTPVGQHTLAVSVTGAGAVRSTPVGIDCGLACAAAFGDGATIALSATPAAGSQFTGWSGACAGTGACELKLTADANVSASFAPLTPAQCAGILPGALGAPSRATVAHGSGQVCFSSTSDGAGFVAGEVHTDGDMRSTNWSVFAPDGSWTGSFPGGGPVAPIGEGYATTRIFFPDGPPHEIVYSVYGHDGAETRRNIGSDACGPFGAFRVLAGGAIALTVCGNGLVGDLVAHRFGGPGPADQRSGFVGLRFPQVPIDLDIAAVGDANAHMLVTVHPGSIAGLSDADYAAIWFDPAGNAETRVFSAASGSGTTVLRALAGGGAALQIGGTWVSVLSPGSESRSPVPPWLASHPNYDLEVIRGGRGYALIPRSGAPDTRVLDLFAADGTRCGSTALPVGGLSVGLDGTVIASGGDGGCTHSWWPALLR